MRVIVQAVVFNSTMTTTANVRNYWCETRGDYK